MLRSSLMLINVVMVFALTACSRSNQNSPGASSTESASPAPVQKITSESVVKVAVQGAEIPAGGFADAIIRVTVQSGYHINSNPPTFPYLKATELDMADTDQISLNSVFYPKPLVKTFAFADKPLHVYEGETPLTVSLEAAKTAKKGQQSIPAKLRIQACDDQVCYPPGSIDVVIPVLIK
ncbi:MAG: protein-disulfide reductase DsbD N-terminal domain-containing protein [Pyrinomonadaceae bacterium]|nr:protein-disulfide reductase DsbD N-terminal domain-containing protein [Pyrinomonadaceae bacterium]